MLPNSVSTIFAVILATYVMFLVPTYQTYKNEEDLAYLNTYKVVTEFVDNVRMKGYITPQMYEDFQANLSVGSVLYDTEMVHQHKVYSPVTSTTDNSTFQNSYEVQYDEYYWEQIKQVLYGDLSLPEDKRIYYLEKDDFFQVHVENKTKFKSSMLLEFMTAGIANNNNVVVSVPYGGMVLNEDY